MFNGITEARDLVLLWYLGDRLLCENLQNNSIDALRILHETQTANLELLLFIYETSAASQVLLEYYIRQVVADLYEDVLPGLFSITQDKNWSNLPGDLMRMLLVDYHTLVTLVDEDDQLPQHLMGCNWHIHSDPPDQACDSQF